MTSRSCASVAVLSRASTAATLKRAERCRKDRCKLSTWMSAFFGATRARMLHKMTLSLAALWLSVRRGAARLDIYGVMVINGLGRGNQSGNGASQMGDFDGRIILVTGSATGLGAAIAIGAAKARGQGRHPQLFQEPRRSGGHGRGRPPGRRRGRDRAGRRRRGSRLPQGSPRSPPASAASMRWSTTRASPNTYRTTPSSMR